MPLQKSYDVAAVGTERIVSAPFGIRSVRLDNPSGMWLYIPEIMKYIPPNTLGWIDNVAPVTNTIRLQYVTAPTGGSTSAVTGGPILTTIYESDERPSLGIAYTAATAADIASLAAAIATLQTSVNSLVAGQALQATAAKQDTYGAAQATAAKQDTYGAAQATATAQATAQTSLDAIKVLVTPPNNDPVATNITVATTKTTIYDATGKNASITIQNNDASLRIRVGGSNITTTKGTIVKPGRFYSISLKNQIFYGIAIDGSSVSIDLVTAEIT